MFGLKDSTLQLIIRELHKFKEIQAAVVFGSRAQGTFTSGSDIDIAIKGPSITTKTVDKLSRIFNQELPIPHHVDIVHYEKIANQNLIEHIDRVGKPLPLMPSGSHVSE